MELKLTLPIGYLFEEGIQNVLSNRIQHEFKQALQQLPNFRFQEQSTTDPIWSIDEISLGHTYEILLEIKERRMEKKLILRPRSVFYNEVEDIANLSKLYMILINIIMGSQLN